MPHAPHTRPPMHSLVRHSDEAQCHCVMLLAAERQRPAVAVVLQWLHGRWRSYTRGRAGAWRSRLLTWLCSSTHLARCQLKPRVPCHPVPRGRPYSTLPTTRETKTPSPLGRSSMRDCQNLARLRSSKQHANSHKPRWHDRARCPPRTLELLRRRRHLLLPPPRLARARGWQRPTSWCFAGWWFARCDRRPPAPRGQCA